jgi:hypothetical protein
MTKQLPWILALTAALALGAGCKKDEPAAPAPAPGADPAKVERVKPGLAANPAPSDPAQAGSGDEDGRGRRDRMDRDGDRAVSDEQRATMLKGRAEMLRKRLDTDGDGKLTLAELGAARGRMHFDDPASLDTNHDGDISVDELVAAMKARADLRRARHAGAGGSGGGEGSGGDGAGW